MTSTAKQSTARAGLALLAALVVVAALAGCGGRTRAQREPDTSLQANSVLTCQQIATERSAIAASLQQLGLQTASGAEVARLQRLDSGLAQLAANKRCPSTVASQDF